MTEDHTGGAVDLADHNPFGPVDDEGAAVGHQRDVAKENLFFAHLSGSKKFKTDRDFDGNAVGAALLFALRFRELYIIIIDRIAAIRQTHLAVGAVDRECGSKYILKTQIRIGLQALANRLQLQKPFIGFQLHPYEIGQFAHFT
ncbi:MAG: hypothetical protein BWY50_01750 [Spirochaetes bacterium ADurb.Bin315]|nr:MAG: hypothetical protein BWY50_01750 [Spirochaetes bacterium ADurb.Bin315]